MHLTQSFIYAVKTPSWVTTKKHEWFHIELSSEWAHYAFQISALISRSVTWLNVDLDGIDKRQAITRARSKRVTCRHSSTGPPPFCTRVSDLNAQPIRFLLLVCFSVEVKFFRDCCFRHRNDSNRYLLNSPCLSKNLLWPCTFLTTELFSGGSISSLITQLTKISWFQIEAGAFI